jgi:hypothetical protein
MRYLLLIAEEEPSSQPSEAEWSALMADYDACTAFLTAKGWNKGGEALQPSATATTVSVRGGSRIVTDGPFAETKEQLGGYYIVDCPTLDDAIEAAAAIPGAKTGRIEIRPIMELG